MPQTGGYRVGANGPTWWGEAAWWPFPTASLCMARRMKQEYVHFYNPNYFGVLLFATKRPTATMTVRNCADNVIEAP